MNWGYRLARHAVKALKRFPKYDRKRIFETLEEMRLDPFKGDIKLIQGEKNLYRRRIGTYRIYFRPIHTHYLFDIPEICRRQSH